MKKASFLHSDTFSTYRAGGRVWLRTTREEPAQVLPKSGLHLIAPNQSSSDTTTATTFEAETSLTFNQHAPIARGASSTGGRISTHWQR